MLLPIATLVVVLQHSHIFRLMGFSSHGKQHGQILLAAADKLEWFQHHAGISVLIYDKTDIVKSFRGKVTSITVTLLLSDGWHGARGY